MEFKCKVAIVTGASWGIGEGFGLKDFPSLPDETLVRFRAMIDEALTGLGG